VREAGGPLHLTPGLEIPNASTFIRFSQGELAKGLSLYHKLRPGCVDLEIAASSKRIAAISRIFQDQGYDDIAICEAGKSVALRIVLEPVCFGDDLQSRRRKLQDAIVAGTRLYSIGVKLGSELGRFVNANRTSHGPEQTKRNESSGKNDDVSTKLEAALAIVKADPSPKGYAKANAVLEGSSIVLESRSGKAGIVLTGPVPDMQAFREKK
jgi:hypothetical protein